MLAKLSAMEQVMICVRPVSTLPMREMCQRQSAAASNYVCGQQAHYGLTCSSSRWILAGHARALFCTAARYAAGDAANQFRNSEEAQPYSWSLNLQADFWGPKIGRLSLLKLEQ